MSSLMAGVLGLTGGVLPLASAHGRGRRPASVWARPGMRVTFRAELMPGRSSAERVFRVSRVLTSGRVLLSGIAGEHDPAEFEETR